MYHVFFVLQYQVSHCWVSIIHIIVLQDQGSVPMFTSPEAEQSIRPTLTKDRPSLLYSQGDNWLRICCSYLQVHCITTSITPVFDGSASIHSKEDNSLPSPNSPQATIIISPNIPPQWIQNSPSSAPSLLTTPLTKLIIPLLLFTQCTERFWWGDLVKNLLTVLPDRLALEPHLALEKLGSYLQRKEMRSIG